jgi:uncharacterized protein DUF6544
VNSGAGLPQPLERYLRRAMGGEARRISTARLVQRGTLRMDHTRRWAPFEARETVHPGDIAFEWKARLPFANFLHISVRDAYRDGKADARVRLQSLLTIGRERNNEQGDRGALYRFLAEAPWYPSALFPSDRLHWDAIDDWRALATLTDGRSRVALEFRFDTFGDVAAIYTPERPRRIRGAYEMAAWEGHFDDYREQQQGLRIPMRGEVGWHEDGRWDSVWRGNIVEVRYEF